MTSHSMKNLAFPSLQMIMLPILTTSLVLFELGSERDGPATALLRSRGSTAFACRKFWLECFNEESLMCSSIEFHASGPWTAEYPAVRHSATGCAVDAVHTCTMLLAAILLNSSGSSKWSNMCGSSASTLRANPAGNHNQTNSLMNEKENYYQKKKQTNEQTNEESNVRTESKQFSINPFTPESDQRQISPAASQEVWHHTVWRTWLFLAYSDDTHDYSTKSSMNILNLGVSVQLSGNLRDMSSVICDCAGGGGEEGGGGRWGRGRGRRERWGRGR